MEVGFLNSFLYSQEYMHSFFADQESRERPLPANVFVLHTEANIAHGTHLVVSLSIPTRDETVHLRDGKTWSYYYPKTFLVGLDACAWKSEFRDQTALEWRLGAGLNSPLSYRLGKLFLPTFSSRIRISLSAVAGIHFGIGYVGNVNQGVWMIPFGIGYRL